MERPRLVIIGGGLAGLSAGCYAQASGFQTTILEHGDALGGVCASWRRAPYTIDGCIRWLAGGPFARVYDELGITPRVALRPLTELVTYRNVADARTVPITRDLDGLRAALSRLAPEDEAEIALLIQTARAVTGLDPGIDRPHELSTVRGSLSELWGARHLARGVLHFRKPLSVYTAEHLRSVALRRLLTHLLPEDSSPLFLAMMLGYLERGDLSRPVGGTEAFRDALVASYRELGGTAVLDATADEIVIEHGRVRSVRLVDGTLVPAEHVVCTSSVPETILHLLGGRHGLAQHGRKLEEWRLFGPVLLMSFGVRHPLAERPSVLMLDQVRPFHVGGRAEDALCLRIFNDEPAFAPPGHTVVQTFLSTDYAYWATRRDRYEHAKQQVSDAVLESIVRELPELDGAVMLRDVATPLTYWRTARSWRGAYEGWLPRGESPFARVDKLIDGVENLYLAGQWVEPGGGVPVSLLSGKHAVQLLCARTRRAFVPGVV